MAIIVDFVHVLEYLWKAAWCFHAQGDPDAELWVRRHAQQILAGDATKVAGAIRRAATNAGRDPPKRENADRCAAYLTNKRAQLDYPRRTGQRLADRHRHDRRRLPPPRQRPEDLTGARWGLHGAEAILKLRALRSNHDFDDYWRHHLQQERQRVHQSRYADNVMPRAA